MAKPRRAPERSVLDRHLTVREHRRTASAQPAGRIVGRVQTTGLGGIRRGGRTLRREESWASEGGTEPSGGLERPGDWGTIHLWHFLCGGVRCCCSAIGERVLRLLRSGLATNAAVLPAAVRACATVDASHIPSADVPAPCHRNVAAGSRRPFSPRLSSPGGTPAVDARFPAVAGERRAMRDKLRA
jgi:hypothetical protein